MPIPALIGASLISGASSLLGGILGQKASKPQYVVPNYQKIRDKAEAAGFNPLTALAMAPGQVVQSQNFMGSAIADAGLALADGMVKQHNEKGALAKLAEENDKLREKVQNMTLRPKVGGVYAQREAIPSVSQAVGVKGSANGSVGGTSGSSADAFDVGVGVPSPRVDRASDLYYGGIRLEAPPGFSPAQLIEDNFGDSEFLSAATAPITGAGFVGYNLHRLQNYLHSKVIGSGPLMSMSGQDFVLAPAKPKIQPYRKPKNALGLWPAYNQRSF